MNLITRSVSFTVLTRLRAGGSSVAIEVPEMPREDARCIQRVARGTVERLRRGLLVGGESRAGVLDGDAIAATDAHGPQMTVLDHAANGALIAADDLRQLRHGDVGRWKGCELLGCTHGNRPSGCTAWSMSSPPWE